MGGCRAGTAARAVEVLQPMAAEVEQRLVGYQGGRRGREDHLAAVGERRDAGAAVDVDPDVALCGDGRRARVQPHPHRDRPRRKGFLRRGGRGHGASGGWERDEERVTLRVDLDPALGGERVTQQAAVLGERVRIRARA